MDDMIQKLRRAAQEAYGPLVPLLDSVYLLRAQCDHGIVNGLINDALQAPIAPQAKAELQRCLTALTGPGMAPPLLPDVSENGITRLSVRQRQVRSLVEWLWAAARVAEDILNEQSPPADGKKAFRFADLRFLRVAYLQTKRATCPACGSSVTFRHADVLGPNRARVDVRCNGCGRCESFPLTVEDNSPWTTSLPSVAGSVPASSTLPAPPPTMRMAEDPEVVDALAQIGPQLAACYRQALRDISQVDRESFVGPAAALRELLSFVLRDLAPDDAVMAGPGFVAEKEDGHPTRRQRVKFILRKKGRLYRGCPGPHVGWSRQNRRRYVRPRQQRDAPRTRWAEGDRHPGRLCARHSA